ncbi:MAG: glucokinase [Lysobacterales bacterium]
MTPSAQSPVRTLLADVGGTHIRFALAATGSNGAPDIADVEQFDVGKFPDFAAAAHHYLEDRARVSRGVFAVAGRVVDGAVRMTNHPWQLEEANLAAELGLSRAQLVNDFAAVARAIPLLRDGASLNVIGGVQPQSGADGTFLALGPGTGLGVGLLVVRDGQPLVIPTEGGHVGFAPGDAIEARILAVLARRYGRVSNERLVSGPGLAALHGALTEIDGKPNDGLADAVSITRRAAGGNTRCIATVERLCALLGAVAGDLVLACGAWGGVYLAGGITAALLPWLEQGGFRQRFADKGRYADTLAGVPTAVIRHPEPGLLGAAALAGDPDRPGKE